MTKTLTITDTKVREAAKKCGSAKDVLKTMFPEAFIGGEDCAKKTYLHQHEQDDVIWHDIHFENETGEEIGYLTFRDKEVGISSDKEYELKTSLLRSDNALLFRVVRKG